MLSLTTPAGTYGPFNAVSIEADHYNADGCIMPFSLHGPDGTISEWVPVDDVPTKVVPQSVTRRQFKLALLQIGLLDDVEAMIAASGDRALQINWAEALDFERDNAFVAQMSAALGKTASEVDDLFILANTL